MSNEARVLKEMRVKSGLSMREAAIKIGISSSLISQIENGRENFPTGKKLDRFLSIYKVSFETFKKRVLSFSNEISDIDVISALLPRISIKNLRTVRVLVEQFAKD